jgi:hypothetical protein
VSHGQAGAVCPQCGNAAAVHSIGELADMARSQLGQPEYAGPPQPGFGGPPQPGAPQPGFGGPPQPGAPQPGFGGPPQPGNTGQPQGGGFGGPPQPGAPQPGYTGQPQGGGFGGQPQPGPPQPGYAGPPQPGGPQPGYAQQPRPGPPGGWRGIRSRTRDTSDGPDLGLGELGDDIAGAAMGIAAGAAAKFIGRKIGRKVQAAMTDRVLPAMAARQQDVLQTQIAIAERHPDLRACLTDKVIFLAGGSRVLPMPNLARPLTIDQADALVAQLRNG